MQESTQVSAPVDTASEIRTWALRAASAVALVAVVGAPALASFHGLVSFGTQIGLTGGLQYVVPVALDGAAAYAALLAIRAVLAGDSAITPRLLTCIYALAAASFNALAAQSTPAALFYAGMSLSACLLWDQTLRMLRHDQLRTMGVIEGAAARYRPLRWLLAFDETGRAWRTAVLEDVQDPREALAMVRGESSPTSTLIPPDGGSPVSMSEPTTRAEVLEHTPLALPACASKADALRLAFDELGAADVPAALSWLRDRGLDMDRSYAYALARTWTPTKALRAVGGSGR